MSTSRRMMKRRSLNPNHIQAVSKEPVSGILKAAIINHAGEGEGVTWEGQHHGEGGAAAVGLLHVGQDGLQPLHQQTRQQRGPRSPASRPQHDQSANLKIVTIQID